MKKENTESSKRIQTLSEGIDMEDFMEKEQNLSKYKKYNLKYAKIFSKINVYKPIHAELKNIVAKKHRLTLNDAVNLILLDFLQKPNPDDLLNTVMQRNWDKLNDVAKK